MEVIILIVCIALDNKNGMMFNNRRQSRDKTVIEDIAEQLCGKPIKISSYSEVLFKDTDINYTVYYGNPMPKTGQGEYCFVEEVFVKEYLLDIESFVIYRWNRIYPSDVQFDIDLLKNGYKLLSTDEFAGNSHERITKEIWNK